MRYKLTQREIDLGNKIFSCARLEPSVCSICGEIYELLVKMRKISASSKKDKSKKVKIVRVVPWYDGEKYKNGKPRLKWAVIQE